MNAPSDCPLCAAAGENVLWHNDDLRVIAVDDPDYPGFTRVILQRHAAEMTDLAEAERLAVMRAVFAVESAQREVLGPHKVNLASFGNMVPHVHWHVIPRWHGDRHFPDPTWAAPRLAAGSEPAGYAERLAQLRGRLDAYHARLRELLSQAA